VKEDVDGRDKPGHDDAMDVPLFDTHCHASNRQFKPEKPSSFD